MSISNPSDIRIVPSGFLQFTGTTLAYPALKRAGITLQARLADDSADSPVQVSYISGTRNVALVLTNQVTGASIGAGTLLNAPTAGNPNFWLPVQVNGLGVLYIPCW